MAVPCVPAGLRSQAYDGDGWGSPAGDMNSKLPPPDPFESLGMAPPGDYQLEAPVVYYLDGPPTRAAKRISDVFLNVRPGALIVVAPRAPEAERQD
jgi:hypothetical protein